MSIAQSVGTLTVIFQVLRETLRLEAAWLAGVPYWDAKLRIGEHLLADARATECVLRRLHELKAASAEHKQVAGLEKLIGEIARAANGDEWLAGLYRVVKPWIQVQIETYLAHCDSLMDAPSHAALEAALTACREQVKWFSEYTPEFSDRENVENDQWLDWLAGIFKTAAIEGTEIRVEIPAGKRPANHPKFEGIGQVRRDVNFKTVDQRSAMPREGGSFEEKRFLVFYNHSQEMQFAESLGAIMYESAEMPWAFHHDLARHIADEVRHAKMGQTRLEQLGTKLHEVPMMTQHYEFRSHLNPLERFCLMTLVMEATAFERKRANVELFEKHEDEVSARYEKYDIRDEMLHTNLGHVWVPIMLRVYHDSRSVAQVTEHCRDLIAQVITEYPSNAANMLRE